MKKFTIEELQEKIKREVRLAESYNVQSSPMWKVVEFYSEDLNTFGTVIASRCSRKPFVEEDLKRDMPIAIRKYGATNAIFFLKIRLWGGNQNSDYLGWIYWNSMRISIKSRSFLDTYNRAYEEGIKRVFEAVDETRTMLKLKKLVHRRLQNLGIELESKE